MYNKRLPNWEPFDEITLKVIPRYKTSFLSGDMWRTSVVVTFKFKGVEVECFTCRDMQTAVMMLPHKWVMSQEPIPMDVINLEKTTCDQPSCPDKAVGRLKLKRETSNSGEWLDRQDSTPSFRKFCLRHIERGDCSREDSDANYDPMDKVGTE